MKPDLTLNTFKKAFPKQYKDYLAMADRVSDPRLQCRPPEQRLLLTFPEWLILFWDEVVSGPAE